MCKCICASTLDHTMGSINSIWVERYLLELVDGLVFRLYETFSNCKKACQQHLRQNELNLEPVQRTGKSKAKPEPCIIKKILFFINCKYYCKTLIATIRVSVR